jgi:hypothetical protein
MQILSDGGGIYTLGRQPGTTLSNNHIHHIPLNAGKLKATESLWIRALPE